MLNYQRVLAPISTSHRSLLCLAFARGDQSQILVIFLLLTSWFPDLWNGHGSKPMDLPIWIGGWTCWYIYQGTMVLTHEWNQSRIPGKEVKWSWKSLCQCLMSASLEVTLIYNHQSWQGFGSGSFLKAAMQTHQTPQQTWKRKWHHNNSLTVFKTELAVSNIPINMAIQ